MLDYQAKIEEWLDTFSPVFSMQENPKALIKEIGTIVGVFERERASSEQIDAAFQHIKITTHSRAWPTAAQAYEALRDVKKKDTGELAIGSQGGDRGTLDGIQLHKLESEIIPTARRWLRQYPGLRSHAISTLEYWGEELKDDTGKKFEPKRMGAA